MKVKIDTQLWEVRLVSGDDELESKNWGRTTWSGSTITVDNNEKRSKEDIEETFLHELIHIALDRIGRKEEAEDELLVKALAIKLYDILKTNGFLADIYPKIAGKERNGKKRKGH